MYVRRVGKYLGKGYLRIAALSQQPEATKETQIFLVLLKSQSIHSSPYTTEADRVHFCVWNRERTGRARLNRTPNTERSSPCVIYALLAQILHS
jgi:hypothetical protein